MLDKTNCPILVTGIERSGTSIVAKIIGMCGAFTGAVNEKYENEKLRDLSLDYYNSIGADLHGQFPLPIIENMYIPFDWKTRVMKRLTTETNFQNQTWMYKSSKIGQIWPIWNFAFPNAKWILVRRRSGDVVASCHETAYMEAFKDEAKQKAVGASNESEGWLWWIHEHEKRFRDMIEAGLNCKIVWPERMVDGDYSQMYETLEWLGLKWNDDIIKIIDPLLWNTRTKKGANNGR